MILCWVIVLLTAYLSCSPACEHTLFLLSDSRICKDKDCKATSHGLFMTRTGSRICLITSDDKQIAYHVKSTYRELYYKLIYQACNCNVAPAGHQRCWEAGNCDPENCRASRLTDQSFLMGNIHTDTLVVFCLETVGGIVGMKRLVDALGLFVKFTH